MASNSLYLFLVAVVATASLKSSVVVGNEDVNEPTQGEQGDKSADPESKLSEPNQEDEQPEQAEPTEDSGTEKNEDGADETGNDNGQKDVNEPAQDEEGNKPADPDSKVSEPNQEDEQPEQAEPTEDSGTMGNEDGADQTGNENGQREPEDEPEDNSESDLENVPAPIGTFEKLTTAISEACPGTLSRDLAFKMYLERINEEPAVYVEIDVQLHRVMEVNDLEEKLSLYLMLRYSWTIACPKGFLAAVRAKGISDSALEDFQSSRFLSDIWIPRIRHTNAHDVAYPVDEFVHSVHLVAGKNNVAATAAHFGRIDTICDGFDFSNFPFDTLHCSIELESDLTEAYVAFRNDMTYFTVAKGFQLTDEKDTWDFVPPLSKNITHCQLEAEEWASCAKFYITLKRRPYYFVNNIFLPISALATLKICSLLLSPSDSNRSAFCVTSVLALMVFLDQVTRMIPQTSKPVYIVEMILIILGDFAFLTFYTAFSVVLSSMDWFNKAAFTICRIRVPRIRIMDCVAGLIYIALISYGVINYLVYKMMR